MVYSGQLDLICATLGQLLYECRREGYASLCVCAPTVDLSVGIVHTPLMLVHTSLEHTNCVWEVVCIQGRGRGGGGGEEGENAEMNLEASL